MDILDRPLAEILVDRQIFSIFDEEFRNAGWLDVTALLKSESSLNDLYRDGTVPEAVLDRIKEKISAFDEYEDYGEQSSLLDTETTV
ncbi:MAG: hypothetical protein K6C41_02355 [Lachnospiraceae bacterium]|nr:hypothetical protein [Lachnospiraceae bacterium]